MLRIFCRGSRNVALMMGLIVGLGSLEGAIDDVALDGSDLLKGFQRGVDYDELDKKEGVVYSLERCIYYALMNNEDVQKAYITRDSDKLTLKWAERQYMPIVTLNGLAVNYKRTLTKGADGVQTYTLPMPGIGVTQKLTTGGNVGFTWSNPAPSISKTGSGAWGTTGGSTTLNLTLTQPLLRGAGFELGRMALTQAYLTEELQRLGFRDTMAGVVNTVVGMYRSYVQTLEQFKIQKESIKRAREDYERLEARVELGEARRIDLVSQRKDLASKEYDFQQKIRDRENQRLELLRLMNVDTSIRLVPEALPEIDMQALPDLEECLAVAYTKNTGYLRQLIALRQAELTYKQSIDSTRPQLDLSMGMKSTGNSYTGVNRSNESAWRLDNKEYSVGLTMDIPLTQKFENGTQIIQAKLALRQAKIDLKKMEEDMRKNMENQLFTIKNSILQLKLSKITTYLSKQEVEVKRIQLDAGDVTNKDYTDIVNSYVAAQTSELDSRVSFLNNLTTLESMLGITLESWNINLMERGKSEPRFKQSELFPKASEFKDNK